MTPAFNTEPWSVIRKQAMIACVGGALIFLGGGMHQAISAGLGTLCVFLPSAHYAWVSQRTLVGVQIMAQGVIKMLGTGALMALCLGFGAVSALWFLLGVVAGQGAYLWVLAEGTGAHSALKKSVPMASEKKQNED